MKVLSPAVFHKNALRQRQPGTTHRPRAMNTDSQDWKLCQMGREKSWQHLRCHLSMTPLQREALSLSMTCGCEIVVLKVNGRANMAFRSGTFRIHPFWLHIRAGRSSVSKSNG